MVFFPLRCAWWSARGAAVLVAGIMCAAPSTNAGPAPNVAPGSTPAHDPPITHLAMGTVVSVNKDTLVLRHTVHGRLLSETFHLTPATLRVGPIGPGVKVTIQYQVDRAVKRATFVRAPSSSNGNAPAHGTSEPKATKPSTLKDSGE